MFKGKNIEKGVAFPTCVSVNKCGVCRLHMLARSFGQQACVSAWDDTITAAAEQSLHAVQHRGPLLASS